VNSGFAGEQHGERHAEEFPGQAPALGAGAGFKVNLVQVVGAGALSAFRAACPCFGEEFICFRESLVGFSEGSVGVFPDAICSSYTKLRTCKIS